MWYDEDEKTLDYSKPIKAIGDGSVFLLLPQLQKRSWTIIGYNWFDVTKGKYNSCYCFKTAEEAVKDYGRYEISNADLSNI